MRTLSKGPSPLFSTNMAKPQPTFSPAARRRAQARLHRLPVGGGEQLVHQLRVIAGVVDDVGAERAEAEAVGHRAFVDQIAAADLDGVDADLGGDGVDQPLAHECCLIAAGRAISAARRLVGQPDMAARAVGRHAIGPGQHGGGQVRHGCRVRAHIGAVVVEEFVVDAEDAAVFVDRRLDFMALLARVIGGDQVFTTILYPFDWLVKFQRGRADQHVFRIHLAADAEAAADMALKQLNALGFSPEHERQPVAVPVRHLGGAVHFQHVRYPRRNARWRRAFPAARRCGGRS